MKKIAAKVCIYDRLMKSILEKKKLSSNRVLKIRHGAETTWQLFYWKDKACNASFCYVKCVKK